MPIAEYREKFELGGKVTLVGEATRKKMQSYWWDLPEAEQLKRKERLKSYAHDFAVKGNNRGIPKDSSYPLERRNRRGLCPDQSLQKLTELAEKLGHGPSELEYIAHNGNVGLASLRFFYGKYTTAVKAAGLEPKGGKIHTAEQLLDSIILFREAHGREPMYSDFKNGRLTASGTTYVSRFGGVVEARRLATQRSLATATEEVKELVGGLV
jgi:hypothetical protein